MVIFVFTARIDDLGGCRGNTVQALAQWLHPVASSKARYVSARHPQDASFERQNLDLAKQILSADQINFYLLQYIAQIYQFICITKSNLS